ncbi:hypothetical protein FACS1894219_09280 [Clostridia bacterium]|nr:hypothetical protein FACS1894219_09280 [Clostridia bacterium]
MKMRSKRRIIAIMLTLAMILPTAIFPVSAVGYVTGGTITVGTVTGTIGQKVTVPVSISGSPAMAGFVIRINFDKNNLTPESITPVGSLAGKAIVTNLDSKADKNGLNAVTAAYAQPSDFTVSDGVIFNVVFTVKQGAVTSPVTLSAPDITNASLSKVITAKTDGEVTIASTPPSADVPDITIGTVSGRAGETVTVPVTITKNSAAVGIAGFEFNLTFDRTILLPISVTAGDVAGVNKIANNISESTDWNSIGYVSASYFDAQNEITGNGTLYNITFKISDNVKETSSILTLNTASVAKKRWQ